MKRVNFLAEQEVRQSIEGHEWQYEKMCLVDKTAKVVYGQDIWTHPTKAIQIRFNGKYESANCSNGQYVVWESIDAHPRMTRLERIYQHYFN